MLNDAVRNYEGRWDDSFATSKRNGVAHFGTITIEMPMIEVSIFRDTWLRRLTAEEYYAQDPHTEVGHQRTPWEPKALKIGFN